MTTSGWLNFGTVADAMSRRYDIWTTKVTIEEASLAFLDRTILCAEVDRLNGETNEIEELIGDQSPARRPSAQLVASLMEEIVVLRETNTDLQEKLSEWES